MQRLFRNRLTRLGCGLAIVSIFAGGVRAFPRWWQLRLVEQARDYLARGDTRGAFLSAHEALNRDAGCVPAVELMAQLAARSQSPEEIYWRERLVALQPGNSARRIQLADTALRIGETFVATHALEGIPSRDHSFVYQCAVASLALTKGQLWLALEHLELAHRLQPNDRQTTLMLMRVRLAAPEPETRALAHARLVALTFDFASRLEAGRLLLAEARAQGDSTEAMRRAQILRDLPEAKLSDQLAYLEELDRARSAPETGNLEPHRFENELGRLQNTSGFDEASIYAVGAWLNSHRHAELTLAWLQRLPERLRALPYCQLVEAEAMVASGDGPELLARLGSGHWGGLEYLRLGYLAHARPDREATWQQAVQAAGADRGRIKTLAGLAEDWGWSADSESLWWKLANDPNASLAALQQLYSLGRKQGDAEGMFRVSKCIYQLDPTDLIARNNFAQLSLLLGRATPETRRIASENAEGHPEDWALNSTYAFSLHLQGRDHEALARLLGLPGEPGRDPQMAAYLGVLYAAVGQPESARPLLARAAGADLLPQEAQLVREALTP